MIYSSLNYKWCLAHKSTEIGIEWLNYWWLLIWQQNYKKIFHHFAKIIYKLHYLSFCLLKWSILNIMYLLFVKITLLYGYMGLLTPLKWLYYSWWFSLIPPLFLGWKIIEDQMTRWIFFINLKFWGNHVYMKIICIKPVSFSVSQYDVSKFNLMWQGEGDGIKLEVRGSLSVLQVVTP